MIPYKIIQLLQERSKEDIPFIKTERVLVYSNKIKKMEEKALETLKSMLNARQKKVDHIETLSNSLDDTRMYNLGGVLVIFSDKGRITDGILKLYIQFCEENNYTNGMIIVMASSPSDNILDMIRTHNSDPKNHLVQLFNVRYLQFDISTHRKVPQHRLMDTEEIEKFQKRMNITNLKLQLPWIDSQDAMAKWLGARTGDIIEIQRFSESAGASLYYRYCVSNVLET
jgi:DNA-directed RNA polymerase subunit H (RpoH/RPB5)